MKSPRKQETMTEESKSGQTQLNECGLVLFRSVSHGWSASWLQQARAEYFIFCSKLNTYGAWSSGTGKEDASPRVCLSLFVGTGRRPEFGGV